ncbi:DNA-3-methyladenine glycosylase [Pseudorhizobium endolithicum]|uniref:Putative 3-methyladenine DNA glycosylase n=1 Tax=Pseudorhizobium endolithicum TaxID=1191678 RepID=A0ABM8PYN8_9HYPH|nr:DNA-3-methyladenine glycosylase [Pseudorhizobium endolithicum]CAD6425456.1 DNA-3-methyladenine glycosylase [Rhizobium sp. Q54]CAD7055110.1 DNA-3-methyladenine glycosylase [Pseudorhizobium endolithicum]
MKEADVQHSAFDRPAVEVASDLIGAELLFGGAGGIVVEAEAYMPDDPASHSYRGRTSRNRSMFGPSGHAYVYRSYGIHWCLNVVCQAGSAVLIRALEPVEGIADMQARRGRQELHLLCSGPGRVCQALGITGEHDGLSLLHLPFRLTLAQQSPGSILTGKRIGITRAVDMPWRFGLKGSVHLSRRFPTGLPSPDDGI